MRGSFKARFLRPVFALCLASAGLLALLIRPSEAQGGLRATVLVTQARVPDKLTEAKLLRFFKGNKAKSLRESNEPKLQDRSWRAEMVTSFTRAPGDNEFVVLFYDIESGSRNYIMDMPIYMQDRNQKTIVQSLRLPRSQFKPNRKMELVVTVRRQEVASYRFVLVGEEAKRSGRVDFTEDET